MATEACGQVTMTFGYAEPCTCVRPRDHEGPHQCDHETPADAVAGEHFEFKQRVLQRAKDVEEYHNGEGAWDQVSEEDKVIILKVAEEILAWEERLADGSRE